MLPAVEKYSTYHHAQYIPVDSDNERLCYWFRYLLQFAALF